MSDDAFHLYNLTDSEFLANFNSTYPQQASWKLWTLTPRILSTVTLSLHRKLCDQVLVLLNVPPAPTASDNSGGPISVTNWLSTPNSPTSKKIQLPSSKFCPVIPRRHHRFHE
jgi:hypothetical protein